MFFIVEDAYWTLDYRRMNRRLLPGSLYPLQDLDTLKCRYLSMNEISVLKDKIYNIERDMVGDLVCFGWRFEDYGDYTYYADILDWVDTVVAWMSSKCFMCRSLGLYETDFAVVKLSSFRSCMNLGNDMYALHFNQEVYGGCVVYCKSGELACIRFTSGRLIVVNEATWGSVKPVVAREVLLRRG